MTAALVVSVFTATLLIIGATAQSGGSLNQSFDVFDAMLKGTRTAYRDIADPTLTSACVTSARRACDNNQDYSGYRIGFTSALGFSDYDFVQFKVHPTKTSLTDTTTRQQMCKLQDLKSTWRASTVQGQGSVLYQYFASKSELFAIYPASAWNCTDDPPYTPTLRPYYTAGAAGQKDLVIMIDISPGTGAADRLAKSIVGARALLDSLSFRDYVAVLPYNEFVTESITPSLVQATNVNIELLKEQLTTITLATSSEAVNLGFCVEQAITILDRSAAAAASSGCTKVIHILGGGANHFTELRPADVINAHQDVIVFSTVIAPTVASAVRTPTGRIACQSKGVLKIATTEAEVRTSVSDMNAYFAALRESDEPKWSEVYTDAFGQGQILSGALPVYDRDSDGFVTGIAGVFALDVPLRNFTAGTSLTSTDVNLHILRSQACQAIDPRSGSVQSAVTSLQGDTCSDINDEVAGEELGATKLKALWVFLNVFFLLLIGLPPLILSICHPVAICGASTFFTMWIIAMSIFFSEPMWTEVVEHNNFDKVDYTVQAHDANPYRCCDTINCQCREVSGSLPACASLHAQLVPGDCGNGYRCCRQYCYECNCRTYRSCSGSGSSRSCSSRRSCSTCCRCVADVNNDRCEVACGTCHRATLTVTYTYNDQFITSKRIRNCGRDDFTCRDNYFAAHPIGSVQEGWVNPENPKDLRGELKWTTSALVIYILLAVFSIIPLVISYVGICARANS